MNKNEVEIIGKKMTELTKRAPFGIFKNLVKIVMEFDN